MGRKRLKKKRDKGIKSDMCRVSTNDIINSLDCSSDNIVRLKVTIRKGARIESVPLKKLEKLSTNPRTYWKLEDGWLMLYGLH